jgi:hypothetical protein
LDATQTETLRVFHDTVRSRLKPVLGDRGLRRLSKDLAIATSAGGGVVMHAPLELERSVPFARLLRERRLVGALVTTSSLYDPLSHKPLEPGAYAVGLRPLGRDEVAFDFYGSRGKPAISMLARNTDTPEENAVPAMFDVDITRGGIDSFVPPGQVVICLSFYHWFVCFLVTLPPGLPPGRPA